MELVPLSEEQAKHLDELRKLPAETERVEFKENCAYPEQVGEYLSALSNGARLSRRANGYLVFGIKDSTHEMKGIRFRPSRMKGKGNKDLIPWLLRGLDPPVRVEVTEGLYEGKPVVLFEVSANAQRPVKFWGTGYIRVSFHKYPLGSQPEKERALWNLEEDWSKQLCPEASLTDLDPQAIARARAQYKVKYPQQAHEADSWSDARFLDKARVTVRGKITNAAILLLGREEAEPLLSPAQGWMRWTLKKEDGGDENYEDFRTPIILTVDRLFERVRNLKVRFLPDGTLFPVEINQYDPWVIREALHNAIAHQDYRLAGRIVIVEKPDELIFSNKGTFLPGSVEQVVYEDIPPETYRNPWLCQAMVNLGMIDTQGGGIRRMFMEQKKRFFPMPEYDFGSGDEVRVHIPGRVIDIRYTKLLMANPGMSLEVAIMLDRVQRNKPIGREQYDHLKRLGMVEGRWNAYHLSAEIARRVGKEVEYTRLRGLTNKGYEELVLEHLRRFPSASRAEINQLLMPILPDVLDESQKQNKIHNLLSGLVRKRKIKNQGARGRPRWVLSPLIEKGAKKRQKQ